MNTQCSNLAIWNNSSLVDIFSYLRSISLRVIVVLGVTVMPQGLGVTSDNETSDYFCPELVSQKSSVW